eukprot:364776-Chlamydomonas_euryale.AAC.4
MAMGVAVASLGEPSCGTRARLLAGETTQLGEPKPSGRYKQGAEGDGQSRASGGSSTYVDPNSEAHLPDRTGYYAGMGQFDRFVPERTRLNAVYNCAAPWLQIGQEIAMMHSLKVGCGSLLATTAELHVDQHEHQAVVPSDVVVA